MLKALTLRVAQAVLTLWVTSVLAWVLLLHAPGDPARTVLGARGIVTPTPALLAATRKQLGLDGPVLPRYGHWLWRALHGDFGTSWQTGRPVMDEFATRLPATGRLTLVALGISVGLALVLGLMSAITQGRWADRMLRAVMLLMIVVPGFVVGLFVLNVLVVHWNLGVVVADGRWRTVGWPAATLALWSVGYWGRILRGSVLEAAGAPYLLVSRARGCSAPRRWLLHVLPNAAGPFLTVVGLGTATLLGGAPIVETVYSWPGVGEYTVQAIGARDLPVVVAYTICAVGLYVVFGLLVDVLLAALDPRLRRSTVRSRPRRAAVAA